MARSRDVSVTLQAGAGAAELIQLRGTARDVTKEYGRVSAARNDAVHGRTIDAVSPKQADATLSALDMFIELFDRR